MLQRLFAHKDLYEYMLNFLSYEECKKIMLLNKFLHDLCMSHLNHNHIMQKIKQKFYAEPCKKIYLDGDQNIYEKNLSLIYFLDSFQQDQNVMKLTKFHSRQLYIDYQLTNGDILSLHGCMYILHKDELYKCNFQKINCIPKEIQKIYGLTRWTNLSRLDAFVSIQYEDFNFQNLIVIDSQYMERVQYIKLWNHKHGIWILIYIRPTKASLEEDIKHKIELIRKKQKTIYHHMLDNRYFIEQDDIQIHLMGYGFLTCKYWFLEL